MAGRCVIVSVGLLLILLFTIVEPSLVKPKSTSGLAFNAVQEPEGCTMGTLDQPPPNLQLYCQMTPNNVNAVLHEMKQPQFASIGLEIFHQFQFGEEAFHPNLQGLAITGNLFSISPDSFNGLSNLQILILTKSLNSDSTLYKANIKTAIEKYGSRGTRYPFNISDTLPTFGIGWLSPLTNLSELRIIQSNISGFRVDEFCSLNRLQILDLSQDRINSTEGLGITCNSSSLIPCLSNVTHLNITGNPIQDFTPNIRMALPSLKSLNVSQCKLSILYFNAATSESMEVFDARNNKLHSIILDAEHPCDCPYLQQFKLQNNQLHTIPPKLFLCMPRLQQLNLSGNALTEETLISAGLNSLTQLKSLDLSYSNITTLQAALIGNMTELVEFWCTSCSLSTIHPDTFIQIKNLKNLVLKNNHLSMKDTGIFSPFSCLNVLDLSGNAVKGITLAENLISLTQIDLSDNQLTEMPEFIGLWLNVTSLALDNNQIVNLTPRQISGLANLMSLSLAFNNIEIITDYTFINKSKLEMLVLSNNRIKTISEFGLDELPSLTHLKLDNNLLMEVPPLNFFSLTKLMFLNISHNLISTIRFANEILPLRGIDLSHNHISQMKFHLDGPKYLQYVNLSYNHLSTLDEYYFTTFSFPRPSVYLQENPLYVDCHSEWLLDTKLDKALQEIRKDRGKTYGWTQPDDIYSDPIDKEDPYVSRVENMLSLYYFVKIADWDLIQCTTATGEHKSFTEITSADFVCQNDVFCPVGCKKECCKDIYRCPCTAYCNAMCSCYTNSYNLSINYMNCSSRNLTSLHSKGPSYVRSITLDGNYLTSLNASSLDFPYLRMLNASNSHISHLQPGAFRNLKMLRVLHLQQNNIEKISQHTLAFLINLEELYLQENKIHQIDDGSFDDLHHLHILWLNGNNLQYLHPSLFKRIYSLHQLTLHDNPWSCKCQSGPAFKEWLIYSDNIVNHAHIYCNNSLLSDVAFNNGTDLSKYHLINTTLPLAVINIDFTVCTNRSIIERVYHHTLHSKSITEVVALAAVFVVVLILILVISRTRLLLKVWFYNKFGLRFHQDEDDNDDKPYDLFIAYAKCDERIVMYELLPKLEEGGMSYKVCLECRDWHPGHTTTDAVVASVQLSKRTIVLVTPNHLDTQWCEYSFDAAHYQVLKDKQIRLILVLTDKELEARMTRAMKLYMKTNTYLVIGEKWFWKKLRYYLADNPRGADHVVGREFRLMNAY